MASLSHLRPLSFGEILDSAFGLYRRHFVPMILTTLIPTVPAGVITVLVGYITLRNTGGNDPDAYTLAILPVSLLTLVLYLVMWAALAHLVAQAWTGGEVSVADGYQRGFQAFFPLLLASILAGIMTVILAAIVSFVLGVGVAIVAMNMGPSLGQSTGAITVIVVVTMIALFLGAIAYGAMLFAVLPAIVIERLGPAQAIGRSIRLGRGARLRVIGVVAVTLIIVVLPVIGTGLLTGSFDSLGDPTAVPSPGQFVVQQVAAMITGSLTTPFMVAALMLLYFDRRVRLEAFDLHMAVDGLPAVADGVPVAN